MNEIQHCNLCAWRGECQIKYKLIGRAPSARFCNEFSRDVALGKVAEDAIMTLHSPAARKPSRKSEIFTDADYRKPRKRYMVLDDEEDLGEIES